jgi:hypothetical protein
VWAFGFDFSHALEWSGLKAAEKQVNLQSAAEGLAVSRYRAMLRHRYTDIEKGGN